MIRDYNKFIAEYITQDVIADINIDELDRVIIDLTTLDNSYYSTETIQRAIKVVERTIHTRGTYNSTLVELLDALINISIGD